MATEWLANYSQPYRDSDKLAAWDKHADLIGRGGAVGLYGRTQDLFEPWNERFALANGLNIYPQMSIKHVRTWWQFLRHCWDCRDVAKHFQPKEMNVAMEVNSNWTLAQVRRWLPIMRRFVQWASPGTRVWFSVQWEQANNADIDLGVWLDFGKSFGTLGVSSYPGLAVAGPKIGSRYYALKWLRVPTAVWECGISNDVDRASWITALDEVGFEFVAILCIYDMPWYADLPDGDFFTTMGILDVDGKPKPGHAEFVEFCERGKRERDGNG